MLTGEIRVWKSGQNSFVCLVSSPYASGMNPLHFFSVITAISFEPRNRPRNYFNLGIILWCYGGQGFAYFLSTIFCLLICFMYNMRNFILKPERIYNLFYIKNFLAFFLRRKLMSVDCLIILPFLKLIIYFYLCTLVIY